VEQAIEDGADLVSFSGDKLLGGPQAGILAGRREWCEKLSRHPVARVVRLDKAALAALAATLEIWLEGEAAFRKIPLLRLLARGENELQESAESLAEALRAALPPEWSVEVRITETEVGGGSLPGRMLPSRAVALAHPRVGAEAAARALRAADPPVVGRIEKERCLLETRALLEGDEQRIVRAAAALAALGGERT
jgi:L-seryl-tRNA(Ser) seleniumtransferase